MKRTLTGTLAAAVFLATTMAPPPAGAQAAAPKKAAAGVEDEIKTIEKERAAAAIKADVATLGKYTSDDYTFINRNGKLSDKAQTMSNLKSGAIKLSKNDVSDMRVRVYGDTAVVTGRTDVKGTIDGKDMTGPVLFTRVYVKQDGRWQSVAFQQTPVVP
jgi:ketosteroid isomerase-like protein